MWSERADEIQYRSASSGKILSEEATLTWRIVQLLVWLTGAVILSCLIFLPQTGIKLFWNILIPVAPAVFVLALGIWRNVCPLATTNLLPRHLGLSRQKKMSQQQAGLFGLIAVLALFTIVPLRHAVFNRSGMATAVMIMIMAAIGIGLGFIYEWKSAWCSGLCPIHPVEKLYGENVLFTVPNVHCRSCQNCVVPCPDSTPNMHPALSDKTIFHTVSGVLIIGGLPGFIWGWFHVPDVDGMHSWSEAWAIYQLPLFGLSISLCLYMMLMSLLSKEQGKNLVRVFAAMSVSCYYWYRIPALLGFGNYADDGQLIDLSRSMPFLIIVVLQVLVTAFLFYWLVFRKLNKKNWAARPAFAKR
ncbi:MAG TPA: hypothetical protein VK166_20235 [Chitinophagaceae bacterium]|nr:hypothetical protein [Chitinophagaceae bacterium]